MLHLLPLPVSPCPNSRQMRNQLDSRVWDTTRFTTDFSRLWLSLAISELVLLTCFQLPQERGGSAPSMSVERSKSWLPSMFHRSKHASRQKDVMKKLKDNLRCGLRSAVHDQNPCVGQHQQREATRVHCIHVAACSVQHSACAQRRFAE